MNDSIVYTMNEFSSHEFGEIDYFICATHDDDRAKEGFKKLVLENKIKNVLAIKYEEGSEWSDSAFLGINRENITKIYVGNQFNDFIYGFKEIIPNLIDKKIAVDISSIKTPDIFSLLKMLKLFEHKEKIECIYSIPYDYKYVSKQFSYKASLGDLENYDLQGYGGDYDANEDDATFVVFLGFENALSLKVLEDTEYKRLNFVNSLPSFYQKYKDISIVNNSAVIKGKSYEAMYYVPANNPFEVYNMLENKFHKRKSLCISPLSSKSISLGVCLYALNHENVRIVYPMSTKYSQQLSNSVWTTFVYVINLTYAN